MRQLLHIVNCQFRYIIKREVIIKIYIQSILHLDVMSTPHEHAHTKLWESISSCCHQTHSGLIVHSNKATQGISCKKTTRKPKNINYILHQHISRLQVVNNIHIDNKLLVFWIIQGTISVPKAVKSTYALTWRTSTYNISITLSLKKRKYS